MALIFFKDYTDIIKKGPPPIVERLLIPSAVLARLNLQQDQFSSLFSSNTMTQLQKDYKFVSPRSIPFRTWGLAASDTNLLMVPNVVEGKADLKSIPDPPIPSSQIAERGQFLAYAMRSFRELMTIDKVVYDDYTFEIKLSISHKDQTDSALTTFSYDPLALTLKMDIELGSISNTCLLDLYTQISKAFISDFSATDFFEDIGESAIEGQMRLNDWAQSLIEFVK